MGEGQRGVSAALRIRRAPSGPTVGAPAGPVDPWFTRLVKLVPAEAVAVYLAGRPLAAHRYDGEWPVVCLALVVILRAWGTSSRSGPQWASVAISGVSFVLWVYATGGRFLHWNVEVNLASLAVLVWTTLVPVFWRGDASA